jgi:hypothetical protein
LRETTFQRRNDTAGKDARIRKDAPDYRLIQILFCFTKLPEQLVSEIARRDSPLLDKQEMKRFSREAIAKQLRSFFSQ